MRRNDNFNLCGYQKTLFFVRFFDFLYIIFYFLKFVVSLHSVISKDYDSEEEYNTQ